MPCSPVTLPPSATHASQDLVARRQHALHLVRVALVEEQDRVDVAVAGMEDVADPRAGGVRRWPRSRAGCRGSLRARHHAVLRAVARRQPADGAERLLAALPQQRPAPPRSSRHAHLARAVLLGTRPRCARRLRIEPRLQAVDLHDAAPPPRRAGSRSGTPPRRRRGSGGPASPAPPARCRRR